MMEEPPKKSKKVLWIILSVLGVVVIVGGIVAAMYIINPFGSKDATQNNTQQPDSTKQTSTETSDVNKDRAACMAAARSAYVDYLASHSSEGVSQSVLDTATASQQAEMDKCNKQFPLK